VNAEADHERRADFRTERVHRKVNRKAARDLDHREVFEPERA
jgi:hypothetical protein